MEPSASARPPGVSHLRRALRVLSLASIALLLSSLAAGTVRVAPTTSRPELADHLRDRDDSLPHPAGVHSGRGLLGHSLQVAEQDSVVARSGSPADPGFGSHPQALPSQLRRRVLVEVGPQVTITCNEPYLGTHNPTPLFMIDFQQKVMEIDPLQLFNMSGTNRTDVAYELNTGRIWVLAYVSEPGQAAQLQLSVAENVTQYANGQPNFPATATLYYRPKSAQLDGGALAVNAAFGASVAASLSMSWLTSLDQPFGAPGVMGHAVLGLVSWAQRFYMGSQLPLAGLPDNFRQLGNTLSWSMLDIRSPLESRSPPFNRTVSYKPLLVRVNSKGQLIDTLDLPLNVSDASVTGVSLPIPFSTVKNSLVITPDSLPLGPPPVAPAPAPSASPEPTTTPPATPAPTPEPTQAATSEPTPTATPQPQPRGSGRNKGAGGGGQAPGGAAGSAPRR